MPIYGTIGGGLLNSPDRKNFRFQCQQSGHCCCSPNIIVTLTFMDVFDIFLALDKDFESLLRKLTFYKLEGNVNEDRRKKLVLPAISSSDGDVIPGIKKINGLDCIFYLKPKCLIYRYRPLACKNYPFTFSGEDREIKFSWAKNAEKTCLGIGEGDPIDYSYVERNGKVTSDNLNMHTSLIQELNTESANGKPLTVREIIWIFIVYGEKKRSQK